MSGTKLIQVEIYNSVFGDPWHGSPVEKILEEVSFENAFIKPINNAHNVAELVLHMWAWTFEVTERLKGKSPSDPIMGDWPAALNYNTEKGWEEIKNLFYSSTKELIELLKNVSDENLEQNVEAIRDPALGTGMTLGATLHGITQHNAYHAGQISLLKKYFK